MEQEGDEEIPVNKSNDLMTFDSESSDGTNEQIEEESQFKPENEDIEDEPKPDYNDKQVRFHSEVLDADENKLEPLKVKSEDSMDTEAPGELESDDAENSDGGEENDAKDESDKSDTGSNAEIPNVNMDSFDSAENNDNSMHNTTDDTERLEEEIIAPGEFYFGEEASTHF